MAEDEKLAGFTDISTGERTAPAAGAAQVPSASTPAGKSMVGLAVGAISVAALYVAQDVLIPITLAVMLSFVLSPLADRLQRIGLWRAPSVFLTVLAALGVLVLLGTLIGSQAASLSGDAPRYAQTIEQKVQGVQGYAVSHLASLTRDFAGKPAKQPPRAANLNPPPGAAGPRRPILVEVAQPSPSPLTIAKTILAPIMGPLETTVIVLIVTIFVLMQKEDLRDRFIRVFGSNDLHRTTMAMDDAGQRLSRYFLSQLAVNTGFGIVIGIGLWLIGIPSPAMWGILAGMLRFVPYIGSFLAAVAPAALGAAIDPGWTTAIYVVALFFIVEPLVGYVVEPLLYGHSTGLSPVSVIVAAVFWTWIWGPIGLILSTPLTLCLVVLGRHVKSLEFFDVLLGDRPALSSVESFYQRVLANNPDEALAQAETLLEDRPLIDYYDGVVLEGLKLAAEDQARGTINADRTHRIAASMLAVIDDLKDHVIEDEPPEARRRTVAMHSVACIAGRGPFDDAVAAMLVQLMEQRHVEARAIAHNATSRNAVGQLDLGGVGVLVLSYLELSGSPAHLRYLIRRLRQHAPGAAIVVGLWPEGDGALSNQAIQLTIGADRYVRSLSEATEAAMQLLAAPERAAVA